MTVTPADSAGSFEHEGTTYYFCSKGCLEKFRADPGKYLNPEPLASQPGTPHPLAPSPSGKKWTCPMHPQIVQDKPGSCPICGMALEPMDVSLDDENPELVDMTRRFWISTVLSIPLLVAIMPHLFGVDIAKWIPHGVLGWTQFALATPVVL